MLHSLILKRDILDISELPGFRVGVGVLCLSLFVDCTVVEVIILLNKISIIKMNCTYFQGKKMLQFPN